MNPGMLDTLARLEAELDGPKIAAKDAEILALREQLRRAQERAVALERAMMLAAQDADAANDLVDGKDQLTIVDVCYLQSDLPRIAERLRSAAVRGPSDWNRPMGRA